MGIVADVFECVLIDDNNNVIGSGSLTESNIAVTVQENDVRYGRGNMLAGVLHSDRDIALNFTEGEFKYDWLAQQLGQDIKTGANVAYAMPKWYKCVDDGLEVGFELEHEPLEENSGLKIFDKDGKEIVETTGYTVEGKNVAIVDGEVGDVYEVRTYKYATDSQTQEIVIDNSVFGKGVSIAMETLEINPKTEKAIARIQYIFDNCLPSGNFTINTASARTAQTHEFSFRVIKPADSTVVGKMLRIPVTS